MVDKWGSMGQSGAKWRTAGTHSWLGRGRDSPIRVQRRAEIEVFLGWYQHTVDDKGRIVMPSKFRDRVARGVVVTKGQERCLYVFPSDRFEEEAARINRLPRTNRRNRDYARAFFGSAADLQADKQGRLQIPQPLRAYAGLEKDVVVVGVFERIEIWDAASWAANQETADDLYSGIEEALSEEGV